MGIPGCRVQVLCDAPWLVAWSDHAALSSSRMMTFVLFFRDGMSREEAEDLVSTALQLAMARDGSSGGLVRLVTVDKDGAKRRYNG